MGIRAGLGVQEVVPPAEAGGVVADELFVVHVVVVSTSPHREDVSQTPGEVIATVGVNGLEEAKDDPGVHGDKMQISSDIEHQDRRSDNAQAEKHGFDGRSVLSSQSEGGRVGMVHLVNGLVQRPVVQASMEPVVPSILHNKHDGNLNNHLQEGGEWHTVVHAEVGGNGMEEPNLRKLGGEVADENDGGTVPLLLEGGNLLVLDLVLVEIGNLVHNKKRDAASKVDDFVHDEAHDAGREGIILHKEIPSLSNGAVSQTFVARGWEELSMNWDPTVGIASSTRTAHRRSRKLRLTLYLATSSRTEK